MDSMNQKRMEEAEDVDVNAGIHGNWNMENAKSMLHQFIQMRRIKTDYKYSAQGSSFVAEMSFYVKVSFFLPSYRKSKITGSDQVGSVKKLWIPAFFCKFKKWQK